MSNLKKYNIIYADPPWKYKVYSKKGLGRSAESHYPTMDLEAIKALPIDNLADKDCALFLWVTFPCLQEAFEVIKSWGFTYKTVAFVWIKLNRISNSLFWAWDIGHVQMQNFAFSQLKDILNGNPVKYIKLLLLILKNTVRNRAL